MYICTGLALRGKKENCFPLSSKEFSPLSINVLLECASWTWSNVMIGLGYQKLDSEMSRTGNMCLRVSVSECSETLACGIVT